LNYNNENNELVTYRKNITNFVNIDKGDFLTSSNIKDNNGNGGFAKISKDHSKRKHHFAKSSVSIDWDDPSLDTKYNVVVILDENGIQRKTIRLPVTIE